MSEIIEEDPKIRELLSMNKDIKERITKGLINELLLKAIKENNTIIGDYLLTKYRKFLDFKDYTFILEEAGVLNNDKFICFLSHRDNIDLFITNKKITKKYIIKLLHKYADNFFYSSLLIDILKELDENILKADANLVDFKNYPFSFEVAIILNNENMINVFRNNIDLLLTNEKITKSYIDLLMNKYDDRSISRNFLSDISIKLYKKININ